MVAVSYKQDISDIPVSTSLKGDLDGVFVQIVALVSEIENELDVEVIFSEANAYAAIDDLTDLIEKEIQDGLSQSDRKEQRWVY